MKNIRYISIIALAALMLSVVAHADSLVVDITAGAVLINADNGNARSLLRFDLPSELNSAEIVFAELTLPVESIIPDSSALAIYCHPLLVDWNADEVAWADLGDSLTAEFISEEGTLFATASEGNQTAYFDITGIVRLWQGGSLANNGLVLFYDNTMPPYSIFQSDGAAWGQVKIVYSLNQ
jgi:hypothetical protein